MFLVRQQLVLTNDLLAIVTMVRVRFCYFFFFVLAKAPPPQKKKPQEKKTVILAC